MNNLRRNTSKKLGKCNPKKINIRIKNNPKQITSRFCITAQLFLTKSTEMKRQGIKEFILVALIFNYP